MKNSTASITSLFKRVSASQLSAVTEELQVLYIRYSWPVNLFKADLDRAADRRSQ